MGSQCGQETEKKEKQTTKLQLWSEYKTYANGLNENSDK